MTAISYNFKQAFVNNLIQYLFFGYFMIIIFHSSIAMSLFVVGISFLIIVALSLLISLGPYMDDYKKVSTLYKDENNNLYIDKVLVDKKLIESICVAKRSIWKRHSHFYHIMTFTDLPKEIKAKNFNKNVVVFCEIQAILHWPNFKNRTEKILKDMGIEQTIQYL